MNARGRRLLYTLAIVAILGIAAWLRLWRLDLIEFKNDDGIVLRLAEDWVRLGRVPLVGMPSSVGVPLPPWFIYLVTPFVAWTRDPRVATAAIGVLNVAAVGGAVLLGSRFFSPAAGLIAGLALATNPWAVFYSRKLWPNDLLGPCAVLLFIALDKAVIGGRIGWASAALPIFTVGVQLHFAFGLLAPLALAPLALLVLHRRWRALTVAVGLSLLTAVPYLIHHVQTEWSDVHQVQSLLAKPSEIDAEGPAYVMSWATSWDTWYLAFVHLDRLLPGRVAALAANLQTLLVLLGVGVALFGVLGAGRSSRKRRLRLAGLLLWLVSPAALTIRHTLPMGEQYFPVVPPAAALLIGAGVHWLGSRAWMFARPLAGLAVVGAMVTASIHIFMVVRLLDFVTTRYNDTYGLPLATSEAIAQELAQFGARTQAQAATVDYVGPESGALGYLVRPFFPVLELAGIGQVGLGPQHAHLPQADGLGGNSAFMGPIQGPGLQYSDGLHVLEAVTSTSWTPGQRIRLALTWTAPAPESTVRWAVCVYEPDGKRVAEQIGPLHRAAHVGPGESVLSMFSIETESGAPPLPLRMGVRRVDTADDGPSPEWRSSPIDSLT